MQTTGHEPMRAERMDARETPAVLTAGLILRSGDRFMFQVGLNATRDALGIVRLGGHVEPGETPAQCAVREAAEEACVRARIVSPPSTFAYQVDSAEFVLARDTWSAAPPTPLLVAAMSTAPPGASVTYLGEFTDRPTPGGETQGLVLLSRREVQWLTSASVSLAEFLESGGVLVPATDLPTNMALRPHGQLRALSILLADNVL